MNEDRGCTEFTIVNCLFGAAKLTKDVDVDNYGYTGYGIGFDARSFFSVRNGSRCGKNVVFGADNSLRSHGNSKNKNILILVKSPTHRLGDTTITEEAEYSV